MRTALVASAILCAVGVWPNELTAQPLPLTPIRDAGQTMTPVFEGWYRNADGTISLSFGYFNRNAKETLDIPIGPDNYFSPGPLDRGQPTHFEPRRHWGVFVVQVPSDFGDQRIVWTLVLRGDTVSIPGSLKPNWEIDALEGEAGAGNTPPVLWFEPSGPKGRGPGGISGAPLVTSVGKPFPLTVWASDDGRARTSVAGVGREGVPVSLTWFVHSAPAPDAVSFSNAIPEVDKGSGRSTTMATFIVAGDYVLRVRANDASGVESAGHAQCCWTNGFVKVTVTP